MLTSLKLCRSPCTWHCHHAAERETSDFIPPCKDVANQFARFESGGLQHLGCHSREPRGSTVRGSMMWRRSWKNVCWGSRGCWTTSSSRQRLRSGVVVWMHVFAWMVDILNINFEPVTCCCVLFVSSILVSVNVIDINMCKVLILCEMCDFCVWHFHTVW